MRGIINKADRPAGEKQRRGRRGVAAVLGLLACSAVVWQSSHATFTATTSNDGNSFGTGSVSIIDNDGGSTALFTLPALAPGQTGTACIGVSYTGSLTPSGIHVYFPNANASEKDNGGSSSTWNSDANAQMDDFIDMKIDASDTDQAGTPGMTCSAANYNTVVSPTARLNTLIGTNKDYASGLTGPVSAQNQWRSYRFTYTFRSDAPNAAQGDSVQFQINWEAQK